METFSTPQSTDTVAYGGFWVRLGAALLDALILSPITVGVMFLNALYLKSIPLLLAVNVLALVYRPFLEATRGATFGKMAFNLKVVNLAMEPPNLSAVLKRNVFHIIGVLAALIGGLVMFLHPGFEEISGFQEYQTYTEGFAGVQTGNILLGIVVCIDAIVLLADRQKRSWHDRIGQTYVVETVSK